MWKRNSLSIKTLFYFLLFSFVILLLVWFTQIEFFGISYELYQINNIKRLAENITSLEHNADFKTNLESLAYEKDVCVEYISSSYVTVDYNHRRNGCMLGKNIATINNYKKELLASDLDYIEIIMPKNIKSVLYKVNLGDMGVVFLNTSLEDITPATKLLRDQLVYIIIAVGVLCAVLSAFLARMINKPILAITNKAKELGKGNYDVVFDKSNIAELDELSDVLTVAASEMNKTDKLKRDLIANVSHDLKTPLTMIRAYAEKVRDLTYNNDEKREKDLNVIIEETDRLNILVNDLLDLNKLQQDAETLNRETYDLVEDVNEIIKRYDILKDEGYKFELDLPKVAIINADKSKVEQVIYNLINNAVEHTGDDLTVKISIKLSRGYYTVSITDSGKGIPEEEKALVWNKYYKKDKRHKRNVVGSGIGLSIVKEILEKHSCEYGINSEVGKYTTFYFKFKKNK